MAAPNLYRIRWGVICLPLAGLVFTISIVMRGPFPPFGDPEGFASAVTIPLYAPAWLLAIASANLFIFGYFGLYRYLATRALTRLGLWGMVFSVVGIVLLVPLWGYLALAAPGIGRLVLAGVEEAASLTGGSADPTNPTILLLALSGIGSLVGTVLFAIGIWRSVTLPRWTLIPFILHPILLSIPVSNPWLEPWGSALLIAAGAPIAWKVWQESRAG